MRRSILTALTLAMAFSSVRAQASPWTLPQGHAVLMGGLDFAVTSREFIDRGPERNFPLAGRYTGTSLRIGGRFGLTDRLELEASLPFRFVAYTADPIILVPRPAGVEDELDYYQRNVVDFSRSGAGIGDLDLSGRYRWTTGRFALATEVRIKTPTGYRGPEGTFGTEPTTTEDFMAQAGDLVRPSNVRDDVTLGDGQMDVSASMLAGVATSFGLFARGAAGYKLRLGGAGDQVIGDLRVGQAIGRRFLLYVSGTVAYSVQRGRVVGISASAVDPDLPATAYADNDNILLIERRLEFDAVDVGAGFIWRMADTVELNAGYQRTVWGRFLAASNVLAVSVALRMDLTKDATDPNRTR